LLLMAELGNKISFPSSAAYEESVGSYWSVQNNDIDPTCIVSPNATADVSLAVGSLHEVSSFGLQCPFAVRGGGHTPWAGAATIANGIVIDLSAMEQVSVSKDRTTTSVGPGARWIDVYLMLDAMGLAISGGRVASVGVGGLTTGGMVFVSGIDGRVMANGIS
jgi:FAD/FMN-containing dehydrogenase